MTRLGRLRCERLSLSQVFQHSPARSNMRKARNRAVSAGVAVIFLATASLVSVAGPAYADTGGATPSACAAAQQALTQAQSSLAAANTNYQQARSAQAQAQTAQQ